MYNDYMHPRNPFKTKPDYKLLGDKYPSFKKYLLPFSSNTTKKFKINFEDPDALRCLTTVLLKEKFDLDVKIPTDRLIPCIPQRVNYILWVEDLISKFFPHKTNDERLNLIDCGTGASCVFPLISAKINRNWHFLATDIDDYSLECARQNCESNNLADRIKVIKGNSDQLIPNHTDEFIALMCNPPFFESEIEKYTPSTNNTSALVESTFKGGEESFVTKLIEESLIHKDRVKLYTVMLGRKLSCKNLKKKLQPYKNDKILNYADTTFFQGRTIRWGLCWTFYSSLDLNSIYKSYLMPKKSRSRIFVHKIPENKFIYTYNVKLVTNQILKILSDIQIYEAHLYSFKKGRRKIEFNIKTNLNTWSNQRRKKRLAKKQNFLDEDNQKKIDQKIENTSDVSRKRIFDDLESNFEGLKINFFTNHLSKDESSKKAKFSENTNEGSKFYLLNCMVIIEEENEIIYLKIQANEKVQDRDSAHQLFQYLKNNL